MIDNWLPYGLTNLQRYEQYARANLTAIRTSKKTWTYEGDIPHADITALFLDAINTRQDISSMYDYVPVRPDYNTMHPLLTEDEKTSLKVVIAGYILIVQSKGTAEIINDVYMTIKHRVGFLSEDLRTFEQDGGGPPYRASVKAFQRADRTRKPGDMIAAIDTYVSKFHSSLIQDFGVHDHGDILTSILIILGALAALPMTGMQRWR